MSEIFKPQEILDEIADLTEDLESATSLMEEKKRKYEETEEYKSFTEIQKKKEQIESSIALLKESLLISMKHYDERNISSGMMKVHTSTRDSVEIQDEECLFSWLRKGNVYDNFVKEKPVVNKKALNSYVIELMNDRSLPEADACGVSVTENTYLVFSKNKDE